MGTNNFYPSFQTGPIILFLQDNIKQLGGNIDKHNVYCRRCTNRQAGGFDPNYGIQICANEMTSQNHLEDTMAHEMMHAYDHLRFKLDWTNNLRHAACAEVRTIVSFYLLVVLGSMYCLYGMAFANANYPYERSEQAH